MKYPIFIPSKGRWQNARTVKMLLKHNITNYFLVVEKDEAFDYQSAVATGHILVMEGSGYGSSSPARNFCLDYARLKGYPKVWMLDDDITSVYEHNKGSKLSTPLPLVFSCIEKYISRDESIKAVGMRTSASFLKNVKKDVQFNCSLTSIYLLSVDDRFRFRGTMLVDMDYQLQILRAGFKTLRMENFAFTFITPTKIKGGYYDTYTNDKKRMAAIMEFLELNPDVDKTVVRNSTGFYVLANIKNIWRKFKN